MNTSPDRRRFLRSAGAGFGSIALAALLAEEGKLFAGDGGDEPRRSLICYSAAAVVASSVALPSSSRAIR